MIVQTTPEIAEGFFEHLLIMKITTFKIRVSEHKTLNEKVKVYFIIEDITDDEQDKILNLIGLYNQLIPNQPTSIASSDEVVNTQDYWTPVSGFNITLNGKEENTILLQAKIGFGIGLHPSTVLTLTALDKILSMKTALKKYTTFVDIGSGSGILSMFVYYKGIDNIIAFEIQDEAIITMKENFYRNNLNTNAIVFNPYLNEEQRSDVIQDYKEILKTTYELTMDKIDCSKAVFAANMRPKEIEMCRDILLLSEKTVISGMMDGEEVSMVREKGLEKELKFSEWRCRY
ncbi:MAG: 50S ribosomal protein L11 methyltransferase [bacterium]